MYKNLCTTFFSITDPSVLVDLFLWDEHPVYKTLVKTKFEQNPYIEKYRN